MRKFVFILFFCLFFFHVRDASAESKHIVKAGETLWLISQLYEVSLESIIRSNPSIHNPNLIYPGEEIIIPVLFKSEGKTKQQSRLEGRLLTLINEERTKNGLSQLQYDRPLSDAAKLKSIDMMKNGYIAHNSPTYGNANNMLMKLNIPFQMVQESNGAGHCSAEEVFSSWLNSSVNRAIVLNEESTHIGIGYAKGGIHGHYWTIFIIRN